MTHAEKTATFLLQIKAIKLQPQTPFKWASGWKSPIYCDNRVTLSFPVIRNHIAEGLVFLIKKHFPETEVIAAVATGAIPHGTLVADRLGLPLVYVRSAPKEHGLGNMVEGQLPLGAKVTVVEDLVSTGKSSLAAVDALREAGASVQGMAAIFSYGFDHAKNAFQDKKCELFTLTNYFELIGQALEQNLISSSEKSLLEDWRQSPQTWMQ
jgi:orotate phosphoribosyltransferase